MRSFAGAGWILDCSLLLVWKQNETFPWLSLWIVYGNPPLVEAKTAASWPWIRLRRSWAMARGLHSLAVLAAAVSLSLWIV